jgi:hypothetical protein
LNGPKPKKTRKHLYLRGFLKRLKANFDKIKSPISPPNLAFLSGLLDEQFKGGRAWWRIENATFNTLKNQGYQFEHNFGQGEKHLSNVFAYLMFIAFLNDQIQQYACKYFKAALPCGSDRAQL